MGAARRLIGLGLALSLGAAGCNNRGSDLGQWDLEADPKTGEFVLQWRYKTLLDVAQLSLGIGTEEAAFDQGQADFSGSKVQWSHVAGFKLRSRKDDPVFLANLLDAEGADLGVLEAWQQGPGQLLVQFQGLNGTHNRTRLKARCAGDDAFLGAGAHGHGVDHQGESFALWAGHGGTGHDSPHPMPWFMRPGLGLGVQLNTWSRVEADLCSDGKRWSLTTWEGAQALLLFAGNGALEVVQAHGLSAGTPAPVPDWAWGPWLGTGGGTEAVLQDLDTLNEAGAAVAVVRTPDWAGSPEGPAAWGPTTPEYEDADALGEALADRGLAWVAHLSPLLEQTSPELEEAEGMLVLAAPDGAPAWYDGPWGRPVSTLDLSSADARAWAGERVEDGHALGIDGWTADHGAWLPPNVHTTGMDAVQHHNQFPALWQTVFAERLGEEGVLSSSSGWVGSPTWSAIALIEPGAPDGEAGLASVLGRGLGLGLGGAGAVQHHVGGTDGSEPSVSQWQRWVGLAAFSPVMSTALPGGQAAVGPTWDDEAAEHFARYADAHSRLFPYLQALAARHRSSGTPMLMHPALLHADADWTDSSMWMLGRNLLVAPVLDEDPEGRFVALPTTLDWHDWWSGARVEAGWMDAPPTEIPVFVPSGAIVPTWTHLPEAWLDGAEDGRSDLAGADGHRTLRVFGGPGRFTEADGSVYTSSGTPQTQASTTITLSEGVVELGGTEIQINGGVERTYTVEVYP